MGRNKVYSFADTSNYPPGSFLNLVFNIPANNRELKLRSLFANLGIRNTGTGAWYPNDTRTDIRYTLFIGPGVVGREISNMFNFTVGGPQYNATSIVLTEPGQQIFNSFMFFNTIDFTLNIANNSAAATYQVYYSLVCEVEENIIWNGPRAEREYKTDEQ